MTQDIEQGAGRTPEQIALARRTLDYIEAHPKEWVQTTWRCRTGMCFAGWAATLAGRQWIPIDDEDDEEFGELLVALPGETEYEHVQGTIWVRQAAKNELGLSDQEANALFWGDNSLPMLRTYVEAIERGERIRPMHLDLPLDEGVPF